MHANLPVTRTYVELASYSFVVYNPHNYVASIIVYSLQIMGRGFFKKWVYS